MKNFLFVVPKLVEYRQWYNFPLGLAYVVSNMKKHGFRTFCLNLCHHNDSIENVLSGFIKKNQIDILCTGAMSVHWAEINQVLEIAKRIKPDLTAVVGGPIISATPELAIKNLPIDYGVIGEGEESMVALAKAICGGQDTTDINGLIYYDENKNIVKTPPSKSIMDLDSLPFPDYEALEYDKWIEISIRYAQMGVLSPDISDRTFTTEMLTSRSCPFSCTFCDHPLGNKYRQRSVNNVALEIQYLKEKYNITLVEFMDELFSANEKRVYEIIELMKKYNLKWKAQWRINNVNREMFNVLKESGLINLGLGVESMSDKILKSMNKKITTAQVEEAFKLAHEIGVRVSCNLIFGDPEETEETIKESLDWYFKHPEYAIDTHMLLAIPNALVYRDAVEKKIIKDELSFIKKKFPVINLTKMSDKKFKKLRRKIIYWTLTFKNRLEGKIISSKKETDTYNNKPVYAFEIKCPDCGKVSKYRKTLEIQTLYDWTHSQIICTHCRFRPKIKNTKVFYDECNPFYIAIVSVFVKFYLLYLVRFDLFYKFFKRIKKIRYFSKLVLR